MINKPFFGGFSKDSNNKTSKKQATSDDENVIRAGGFQPVSRETQRKNFMNNNNKANASDFVASGFQMGAGKGNQIAIDQMSRTQFENNNFAQPGKQKKKAPMAGGFKINISKKKKITEEMRKLKSLDCDIHDRWVADPVVAEVLKKHDEEIKRAGHDLSDKPIDTIIPKEQIKRLKVKQSKAIEAPKFDESFHENKKIPDMRSGKVTDVDKDSDIIPASKI